MTILVEIPDAAATAYWKAGMLPNSVTNALARALDRERPATLPVQAAAHIAAPSLQPALFGALE